MSVRHEEALKKLNSMMEFTFIDQMEFHCDYTMSADELEILLKKLVACNYELSPLESHSFQKQDVPNFIKKTEIECPDCLIRHELDFNYIEPDSDEILNRIMPSTKEDALLC